MNTRIGFWGLAILLLVGCQDQVGELTLAEESKSSLNIQESLRNFKPALAVRGSGCVTCHAQVNSNIVTDFGYGGDGRGRNYYFGGASSNSSVVWNNGAIYGDHSSWMSLVLSPDKKVIVPKASVPAEVATSQNVITLAGYIKKKLPTANVEETNRVYIGAPNATRLLQIFGGIPATAQFKYAKHSASSPDFSGISLNSSQRSFYNSGEVTCDGDVLINGTLHLENLIVRTSQGCRLHVTESVFISGPIVYRPLDNSGLHNLQIVSSRSINLGLGTTYRTPGVTCEQPGGWYYHVPNTSSLNYRYTEHHTVAGQFTRDQRTPLEVGREIVADSAKLDKTLLDAVCQSQGRNVGFERLLLNAPQVHSRYTGHFKGTIIAEVALFSLSNFKFAFDDVFLKASVLPLLPAQDFFIVE